MLPNVLRKKQAYSPSVWDDFFGFDALPGFLNTNWASFSNENVPAVNVEETDKEYNIEVAAPGLDKKDFHVNVDGDALTISSQTEKKHEEKKNGYLRKEFSYGAFSRSFNLPEGTDAGKIAASHKNGVLSVHVPKATIVKNTKQIKIS